MILCFGFVGLCVCVCVCFAFVCVVGLRGLLWLVAAACGVWLLAWGFWLVACDL